jgi:hypothetical protein
VGPWFRPQNGYAESWLPEDSSPVRESISDSLEAIARSIGKHLVSRNVTLVQLMLNVYYFFLNLLPPYLRTVLQIGQ